MYTSKLYVSITGHVSTRACYKNLYKKNFNKLITRLKTHRLVIKSYLQKIIFMFSKILDETTNSNRILSIFTYWILLWVMPSHQIITDFKRLDSIERIKTNNINQLK